MVQDSEKFLPHLHEPIRREIAVRFAKHELRKLLPSIRDESALALIDNDIDGWWDKLSIRNFWNGIHGMSMGFRLKSLVPLITSLNIKWVEKDVSLDELWFGGKFGVVASLKNNSEQVSSVKEQIFLPENSELLEETIKILKEKQSDSAPRDESSIFVVQKEDKLVVIDGNRRLLQAIVDKKETIKAVVGESVGEPVFYENWVPTQILTELIYWHKRNFKTDVKITDATARVIADLIQNSSSGRIEFVERGVSASDEAGAKLLGTVKTILLEKGVSL
ncbi:MAG: hypothetical protein WAW92_01300 [Minisyncoccia bacterium]